ncbi:hypothetical protein [Actibacterium lipolyticum]|uniref:Uncharacterized protein n=1 Tax=Actibacterium lipolyticum TaxID=1524263 RepID=A0A238KPC7_9RHOB|nr:hypothetical protein [Actibacterium lipolyticum]SMX43972.1 hypothetical protein COL8621_02426 [Actibacterium lipolyticum]
MTRLLVLGSSHTGALKSGVPRFRGRFPDVDVEFFAVPAPVFLTGRVNKEGVYVPGFRKDKDRELANAINGAEQIDLTAFDHILVVGFRFELISTAALLQTYDLLEGTDTGKDRACSMEFVDATMAATTARIAKMVRRCLGPDRNFTLTEAPYPSAAIGERADDYEPARVIDNFIRHPDAEGLFQKWLKGVEDAVTQLGHGFLSQPADTIAAPFATKAQYALGGTSADGEEMSGTDHRHMNGDFGLRVLETFATQKLNLQPIAA